MPRLVQPQQFSRDNGTAGRDVQDVRAVELLWNGLDNWGVRLLANGRYCATEFMRSFKESATVHHFLTLLRKRDADGTQLDLDTIGHKISTAKGLPFSTEKDKKHIYELIALEMYNALKALLPKSQDQELLKQLQAAQAEVEKLRALPSKTKTQQTLQQALHQQQQKQQQPKISPIDQYRRPDEADKIFETNYPQDTKPAAITAFVKTFELNADQHKAYQDSLKALKDIVNAMSDAEKSLLPNYLIEWGMPFDTLKSLKQPDIVRLIALAAYITE